MEEWNSRALLVEMRNSINMSSSLQKVLFCWAGTVLHRNSILLVIILMFLFHVESIAYQHQK